MLTKNMKRYLMLLAAIGLVAVAAGGGSGTFAGFNAEVANNNNYFATGTLFLHDNGGTTTCTSESNANNLNVTDPTGCDVLFNVNSITPAATYQANLALSNAGSLDASGISFALGQACSEGKPTIATLASGLTNGNSVSSLSLSGLTQPLLVGTQVELKQGANTQVFTVSADQTGTGTQSVSVTAQNANFSYTTAAVLRLNAFGAGTLCTDLQFYVQETQSDYTTNVKCAYGDPANSTDCQFNPSFTIGGVGTSLGALTLGSGANGNTGTNLTHAKYRYFVLNVLAPGSLANSNMNDKVTFDLKWHIDQV